MAVLDEITAGVAAVTKLLADHGTSLAAIGAAADKALADIKAKSTLETLAIDAVETAFPPLKLYIEAAKLITSIPGEHAADWKDPVRLAQEDQDNPYADSERAAAAKGE